MILTRLKTLLTACLLLANTATAQGLSFSDPKSAVSLFGGQMTNDGWETIVLKPGQTEWIDSHLVGLVIERDWQIWNPRLRFGVEASLVKHWGAQDHLELNVPLYIRYRALDPWIPIQGASFGLGLSYASEVPQVEVDRKGESQELLAHWYAELELGKPNWAVYPFIRLHHRSDGYVLADFDTGSNAVVFGLRYPF